jgi:hypothetical protein
MIKIIVDYTQLMLWWSRQWSRVLFDFNRSSTGMVDKDAGSKFRRSVYNGQQKSVMFNP